MIRQDYTSIEPYAPKDAFDLLSGGHVHPDDIDTVILSHMHFDHTGDVQRFPNADIVLGLGTRSFTNPGYPRAQLSPFDSTVLEHPRYRELKIGDYIEIPKGSVPEECPFRHGFDIFGDSSFWILDAPGHMPGHQVALARTGDREWVSMGGDCCHHRSLLEDPRRDISVDVGPKGQPGFHKYATEARSSIEKLRLLHEVDAVFVVLAHDAKLDGCMPIYPESLSGWRQRELKGKLRDRPLTLEEVRKRHF